MTQQGGANHSKKRIAKDALLQKECNESWG